MNGEISEDWYWHHLRVLCEMDGDGDGNTQDSVVPSGNLLTLHENIPRGWMGKGVGEEGYETVMGISIVSMGMGRL